MKQPAGESSQGRHDISPNKDRRYRPIDLSIWGRGLGGSEPAEAWIVQGETSPRGPGFAQNRVSRRRRELEDSRKSAVSDLYV